MIRVSSRTAISEPQSVHVHNVCSLGHFPLDVPPAHRHAPSGLTTVAAYYSIRVVVVNANLHLECCVPLCM